MAGASWLRWSLAALMIAITCYHLVRVAAARRDEADVDLTHAAMGVAMALMLVGALTSGASRAWALVFVAPTLWFVGRSLVGYIRLGLAAVGGPLRQTVVSAAMLVMLLVAGAPAARAGSSPMAMPSMGSSATAGGNVLVLALVAGVAAVAISTASRLRPRTGSSLVNPGCQLAMNVTTVYMLLLLL
ncbi:hypothetical protein acdb102_18650 [Acidothermaceae bacterium B102]|nr:hypothetical protein acdb102_18650 [Acidothermaceae bacterium B102]